MTNDKRAAIESLISETYEMEREFSLWQKAGNVESSELQAGERRYVAWYANALSLVPDGEIAKFKDMFEGGAIVRRIRSFLSAPLKANELFANSPDLPESFKWAAPYQNAFADSIGQQRSILQAAIYAQAEIAPVLDELAKFLSGIPEFIRSLTNSNRTNLPAPRIEDEADLQALVFALLRVRYGDVRPEDYVPQHAGARSRIDFLIRDEGIVVETKMTRSGLADRKVGEELLIDWGRYSRHPDCRGILAVIYDPEFRIQNPVGLESDLSRSQETPATRAVVVR